jgi:endonuclease/exonuclease/phosphatase family metal-dependent hydrolase
MFKPYDLDVIGFSEVPDGDWTARVGRILNMEHVYVGRISSANHKDKFKSILSRTPLSNPHEIEINSKGWSPSSVVGAQTRVRGVPLLVYSTHIPGRPNITKTSEGSAAEIIADTVVPSAAETTDNIVLLGDLNSWPGDGPLNRIESGGMRSMWPDLNIDTTRLSTHRNIESGTESGVIDHIYYNSSSGARAIRGGIIYNAFNPPDENREMDRYQTQWEHYGKPLSDHRPVWAELEYIPAIETAR